MKKINIAELLKDCPKGMELDYALFEDTIFIGVEEDKNYPILIKLKDGSQKRLTKYGCHSNADYAKCVIFPKGKTTWEGFVPSCKFKVGDVVISTSNNIHLISCHDKNYGGWESCCSIIYDKFDSTKTVHVIPARFATEEEKAKLFKAIKDNGYRWNEETKTLEKLPKFKVGDRVRNKNYKVYIYNIYDITNKGYKAKEITTDSPIFIFFGSQENNYELVPNKFDINTLVPFEDKVLVRNDESQRWIPAFWGYKVADGFVTTFGWCKYCIPYKGNEVLFKTNNDCDDYFKTWQK